jgi:antirestriction protein
MKTVEAEGGKRRALTRLDKASNDEFRSLSESTKKSNVGATEFLEEKRDITQIASIFKIKEEVVRTTSSATTKTYSSRDSESIHDENMGADIESTSSFDDLQAALNDVSDDESTKEELAVGIKSSPSFEDFLKQLSEP